MFNSRTIPDSCDVVLKNLFSMPLYHPDIAGVHKVNEFTLETDKDLVILLFGPSGTGKDTIIEPYLWAGVLRHVVTATSRKRRYVFPEGTDDALREDVSRELNRLNYTNYLEKLDLLDSCGVILAESENSYVWMPQYNPDLYGTYEEYVKCMVETFGLIEYDTHHGNLYGLPFASIEQATCKPGIPIIRTENNGVRALLNKLQNYNCVATAVLPDSFADIEKRMRERPDHSNNENVEKRLEDSRRWIKEIPELAHLVLHNSSKNCRRRTGLENSIRSFGKLITVLASKVRC